MVQQLLEEMHRIVRDYHPAVGRTGHEVAELIQGTAMFPGGSGLWRGSEPFGHLPEFFPIKPVMLVAHNFDSISSYQRSLSKGGSGRSKYWRILSGYVEDPAGCFFTNALMGLKPGSAIGRMPTVPAYENQCKEFLRRQIDIVQPKLVVALGREAHESLRAVIPTAGKLLHPSARQLNPLLTRDQFIAEQRGTLKQLLMERGAV